MSHDQTDHEDDPVTSGDDESTESESTDSDHKAGDDPAAERAGVHDKPSDEEVKEIEEERERRLDPENRPDNAEVDNTDKTVVDGHLVEKDNDSASEDDDSASEDAESS